ncbi:MAG: 16S rRNA (uracil(1498)-N(3))-methyltransferase [Methylacidiphilales bacterium]|nr:16S rRNA (uracil(1498)-N(3))-methyltransferase [Candidatus Methylacidiphilales bacterium]MDW8349434.1 16S rRNA (uracil(1498)-N(3))-methyltransferase [Verrucomicrobiae bacterium]
MSLPVRAFCPHLHATPLTLPESEYHHLIHVLRVRPHHRAVLFNIQGQYLLAEITAVKKKHLSLTPLTPIRQYTLPPPRISAALALPKQDAWHDQLALSVPLGVHHIQPLLTARSEMHLSEKNLPNKIQKWHRILIESAKQSASFHIPTLSPPQPFHTFLSSSTASTKIIASLEPHSKPLRDVLPTTTDSISLLIGPEGDFTPEEYTEAYRHGYQPVSLGHSVLRCPLALSVLLSQIRFLFPLPNPIDLCPTPSHSKAHSSAQP